MLINNAEVIGVDREMVTVDANGLACPQPSIKLFYELRNQANSHIRFLCDTQSAWEDAIGVCHMKGAAILEQHETNGKYEFIIERPQLAKAG